MKLKGILLVIVVLAISTVAKAVNDNAKVYQIII